jgi:hypothetical protein
MQFIKKHYEKVLLSIVLLGLAVAAGLLPLEVSKVRELLDQTVSGMVETTPKPFKSVDLSTNKAVIQRLATPVQLKFTEPHNIFNPVQWQKRPDGVLVKVPMSSQSGPSGLIATNFVPLRLTVTFEGVEGGTPEFPRYKFILVREGDQDAKKTQTTDMKTPRNDRFTLTEVVGTKEAPTAFKLRLKDEKEDIVVTKDKPYVRVFGYTAELRYPLHNTPLGRKKVKDSFVLPGDTERYKIVAITPNEVVISAESSQKRTTLKSNASPPVN